MDILEIHESSINGQKKQAVKHIDSYGYSFWEEYIDFLEVGINVCLGEQFNYLAAAITMYHNIKEL